MRIFLLFISMSLFFKIYAWSEPDYGAKYGFITPSGYRSSIYSGTFNETLLSLSSPNPGKTYPSLNNLDLYYYPINNISIEIKKRETRFNWAAHIGGSYENLSFEQFNIYSEDEFALNRLIHHGFILKRTGLFTTGLMFIKIFSPIYISGYKLFSFNKLSLHNMTLLNLAEVKNSYITPLDEIQKDSTKIKSSIHFNFSLFETLFVNDLTLTEDYFQRENSFKLTFHFPFNDIFAKVGIRDRNDREFLFETGLNSFIWILKNEALFKVRYINAPLINFSNTISSNIFNFITLLASYRFEFEEEYNKYFISTLKIERKTWRFNIKYTHPIDSATNYWDIEASISHK